MNDDERRGLSSSVRAGGVFSPDPVLVADAERAIEEAKPWRVAGLALLIGAGPFLLVVAALLVVAGLLSAL